MEKLVEILPDKQKLVERATDLVLEKIHSAIQNQGQCTIALAGGSTPKPLYQAIATQNLPWDKVHVFWGDERYVAPDHPDSNLGMTRQAWLDSVDFPAANIHAMPTSAGDPVLDAQKHEAELQEFFALTPGQFPSLDIILLGMGDDGHTASLFPHTEALQVQDRLITVGNKDGQPRLTFTYPLINHAHCVIFLVAGANKQNALSQVFAPQGDALSYPSRLIQPENELWWLLDQSASAQLNSK